METQRGKCSNFAPDFVKSITPRSFGNAIFYCKNLIANTCGTQFFVAGKNFCSEKDSFRQLFSIVPSKLYHTIKVFFFSFYPPLKEKESFCGKFHFLVMRHFWGRGEVFPNYVISIQIKILVYEQTAFSRTRF